jgi:hypothetical protein
VGEKLKDVVKNQQIIRSVLVNVLGSENVWGGAGAIYFFVKLPDGMDDTEVGAYSTGRYYYLPTCNNFLRTDQKISRITLGLWVYKKTHEIPLSIYKPFVRSQLLIGTGGGTVGVGVWGGGHSRFSVRCKGTRAHQLCEFGAGEMSNSGR